MTKKNNAVILLALLLSTISGFICAGDMPRKVQGNQKSTVVTSEYLPRTPYHSVKTVNSDCHRNRVIWSGGQAMPINWVYPSFPMGFSIILR